MSLSMNCHDVAKVEITPTVKFESTTGEFCSREIVITFSDGSTQQIDVYSRNETLPVEIN